MMKKLLALLMAGMLLFSMAACGGDETAEGGNDGGETAQSEVYDAGNVSVAVPSGWKAFEVKDTFGADPNAADPDLIEIAKDAETEIDLFTNPYIKISYFGKETTMMGISKDIYDGAADVAAFTAGSLTWEGFTASVSENTMAVLTAVDEATGAQFQAEVWLKTSAGEISLEDSDVLEILGSVKEAK